MQFQERKPRTFGADDRPSCPICNKPTLLTRRSPPANYDLRYELQIFVCLVCDHQIERIVDVDGKSSRLASMIDGR